MMFKISIFIGSLLGRLLMVLKGGASGRMKKEIGLMFPEMTTKDGDIYIRKFFKNYVLNKLDVFFYPLMNPKTIHRYAKIHGQHHLDEALKLKRGVLLVHPHFGNPQMLMPGIGHLGYALCQVGQAPADVYTGVREITGNRPNGPAYLWLKVKSFLECYLPVEFIHIGRVSLKAIFGALKKNKLVAMTVDGISKGDGMWDFLGRKTGLFSTGPIRVAHRSKAVLLPLFVSRGDDGCHVIHIESEIKFQEGVSKEVAITTAMQDFVGRLEARVKIEPWHYGRFLGYHDASFFEDSSTERR